VRLSQPGQFSHPHALIKDGRAIHRRAQPVVQVPA
jgi:hypothetical protein